MSEMSGEVVNTVEAIVRKYQCKFVTYSPIECISVVLNCILGPVLL